MFDFLLLLHIGMIGGRPQHLLARGIVCVVAVKDSGFGIVDLNDFIGNPVKEIAVMGDDDHSAFVV